MEISGHGCGFKFVVSEQQGFAHLFFHNIKGQWVPVVTWTCNGGNTDTFSEFTSEDVLHHMDNSCKSEFVHNRDFIRNHLNIEKG